jgi:hypothetical protein
MCASSGVEIDLLTQQAGALHPIECKSGATIHPSFFEPLLRLADVFVSPRSTFTRHPSTEEAKVTCVAACRCSPGPASSAWENASLGESGTSSLARS